MNLFVYTPIRIGKKEIGHLPEIFFKIFFRQMGKGYPSMCPVRENHWFPFSYAFAEKHANYHATIPVSHLLITWFLQL
ncbi:hypothetical protein QFZ48_001569 [Chitinophaga sp. W2I13]